MDNYYGFYYDFDAAENELISFNLDEISSVEKQHTGWSRIFLSTLASEILTVSALTSEQSPATVTMFAVSSLALVLSFRKTRHYGNELDDIPVM